MYLVDELRKLAGPATARVATGVRLVEDPTSVSGQPAGSVLVLTAAASRQVAGYRLDVALRDAAAAGVSALVLTTPAEVDRSAVALAERGGVTLLTACDHLASGGDLAGLVVSIDRAIAGDAADALVRAARAVDGVLRAAGAPERVAAAASAALGVEVHAEGTAFSLAGAVPPGGHRGTAAGIVLRLAELAAAAGPADEQPGRSRAQLLTELLVAPEKQAQELAPRARAVGLPVDEWHVVLRLEPVMDEGPERYALLDTVASRTVRAVREIAGPTWNAALAGDALVVVRTQARDEGRAGPRAAVRDAGLLLDRVRPAGAELRCGVSTAHQGLLGLRTSASEARTALRRSPLPLATYDLAGLDRMLEEWYSSDAAQQAVRELLQPILDLGGDRPGHLIAILRAYLDHHGSPARAAEELHMHRNAIGRNIRRIGALLQADLDDPQQRLALQLACRAARI
ncbi:helix-turn-helix domain-containing protein [Nonomuraea sp. NN258]|uniref:PucR family transcriptional regulator n=1 Tax=Nonomuraea antri TaxID=2730852 RepID=UPI001568A224|nr:helix-turn-helix domain-containing protein [Nonomuraea antri]NRQ39344.1 helix-turn-helix domain-containing protein [Nonomuraea antri]